MNSPTLYPALFELATRELHSMNGVPQFAVGRSQSADLPLLDPQCSRRQFQLVQNVAGYAVQTLSENCPTLCNGTALSKIRNLEHGDVLQAGSVQFVYLTYDDEARCRKRVMPSLESEATQIGRLIPADIRERTVYATAASNLETLDSGHYVILSGQMLIGRDCARVQIPLLHSQISRVHAQIAVRKHGVELADLNSANGTFVNGVRVLRPVQLRAGDRIHIGPYSLVFTGKELLSDSRLNNVELSCRDLVRVVRTQTGGQRMVILDRVSLVIQPREFVCLLGPSGSGKSTLLSALSARVPADSGIVTINGENLYANFEAIKRDIAVVPQRDALHEGLRVRAALTWTARLRLPPDTAIEEISEAVNEVLRMVGLDSRADARICELSGGQLKRACVANEIVNRPSLLFLDEATSGLDEQTDAEMMRLFRKIANGGKTVVCVTHNLANVEETCSRVVVLAEGGKLAFVGTPAETREYFRVDKLGGIYEVLKTRNPDEWRDAFLRSDTCQRAGKSVFEGRPEPEGTVDPPQPPPITEEFGVIARQASLLASRYLQIMWADKRSLAMIVGQCLLVAFLIVAVFGDVSKSEVLEVASNSASIMFLLAISSVWFGCNNAAREIVKEAAIYIRERDVNLQVTAYVASKCAVLWGISILQVLLLSLITAFGTGVESGASAFVMLCSLAITGTNLGLLISATSKTSDMAISTVPLVLVPQIILSGAIGKVEGFSEWMAQIGIVLYWGYGGLIACFPVERTEILGYQDWTYSGPLLVVMLHAAFCLAVTMLMLHLSAGRESSGRYRFGLLIRRTKTFFRL